MLDNPANSPEAELVDGPPDTPVDAVGVTDFGTGLPSPITS